MDAIPQKLQSIAIKSACIRLVHEWAISGMPVMETWKNEDGYGTCSNHDRFIWSMYEMQVPSRITIPNLIRDQIDDNVWSIVDHIKDWIRYHHSKNFFHDDPASPLSEYIVKLIWKPDRTIDYVATAKNILVSGRLNAMEKFRFACTYCFVEEIANLREMANIAKDWDFETEPLLVYWSKYLRNELHTISTAENDSVEVIMLEKSLNEYDLWPSIEYFFTKLNKATKFRKFNDVIDRCGEKYLCELLAKVDDKEWNPMCRKSVAKILLNCARTGNFARIRDIWWKFENDVNSKNFISIIEELLPLSMKNYRNFNALTPILKEIWSSAAYDIKQSALRSDFLRRVGEKCSDLVDGDDVKFDFKSRREYNQPLEFFHTLLSNGRDAKKRRKFLHNNFYWLVLWQPLALVQKELLEMYLADGEDIDEMKTYLQESPELRQTCLILLRYGEFDEFDGILRFCWVNETINVWMKNMAYPALCQTDDMAVLRNQMFTYKNAVVKSAAGLKVLCAYLYSHDRKRLLEFVRNIIFTDDGTPDSFTFHLLQLGFVGRYLVDEFEGTYFVESKICRGEMNDLREYISDFLANDSITLEQFKYRCRDALFQCLSDPPADLIFTFKRSEVQDFLAWCHGFEKLVEQQAKKLELFRKIFVSQLKGCVNGDTFEATDSMEEFLRWCFTSATEMRRFKRDMMYLYRESEFEFIGDMLKQRKYRRRMLSWVFENNDNLLKKFEWFYTKNISSE